MGQRVVIAGASGLIGRALVSELRARGWTVIRLVRGQVGGADEIAWDPAAGVLDARALGRVEAVVNLSGENIAAGRWTRTRRTRIVESRTGSLRTLHHAIEALPERPDVLVSASAVGIYGDRGDEVLTETSARGSGFLPDVCETWETHAAKIADLGVRTVPLRSGVVLAREGGALKKLLPLFRAGLGGRVGNGHQWMSWIGLVDAVGAIMHAIENPQLSGPVNAVAPHAVTNLEFTRALATALQRPAFLPVPAFALRLAFGQMAEETLLASARVEPVALLRSGYRFRQPQLEGALASVLQSGKL